jgi:hypothetical protein
VHQKKSGDYRSTLQECACIRATRCNMTLLQKGHCNGWTPLHQTQWKEQHGVMKTAMHSPPRRNWTRHNMKRNTSPKQQMWSNKIFVLIPSFWSYQQIGDKLSLFLVPVLYRIQGIIPRRQTHPRTALASILILHSLCMYSKCEPVQLNLISLGE